MLSIPSTIVKNCDVEMGDIADAKYDGESSLTYRFKKKDV